MSYCRRQAPPANDSPQRILPWYARPRIPASAMGGGTCLARLWQKHLKPCLVWPVHGVCRGSAGGDAVSLSRRTIFARLQHFSYECNRRHQPHTVPSTSCTRCQSMVLSVTLERSGACAIGAPPVGMADGARRVRPPYKGGRCMEAEPTIRASALVDLAAARAISRSQQWAGGAIALLLLMTFWGAWVLLIGSRSCALSYLLWR